MKPARQRDTGIDILRAIFIFMMVWGHVILVLGTYGSWFFRNILFFLVPAYSGFMFCFGYVAYTAYLSKGTVSLRRIFPSVYRPLLAFYISAVCYDIIGYSRPLTLDYVFKLLILWHIPLFSDFLLGFSLTLLASALVVKPLLWVTENPRRTLICGVLLWATTFFPYDVVRVPQIGLLIGAPFDVGNLFPVVQYFVFFVLGVYFSRHQIGASRMMAVLGIVGTLGFWLLCHNSNLEYMPRFPPSPGFILTGIPFILLYYVVARLAERSMIVRRVAVPVGANSLFYALVTNILLFGLAKGLGRPDLSAIDTLLVSIVLMIAVSFCTTIVRTVKLEPSEDRLAVASSSAQRFLKG